MAHARQRLEFRKGPRHRAAVALHQQPGQPRDRLGLLRRQPARPDEALDLRHRHARHFRRRVGQRPEARRDEVHALVRALRGQQHGDEQRVRVAVVERHRRLRVQLREPAIDVVGAGLAKPEIGSGHFDRGEGF